MSHIHPGDLRNPEELPPLDAPEFIMEKTLITDHIKVACVGDSITRGGAIQEEEKRYPAQLQSLLGGEYLFQNFDYYPSSSILF